MNKVNKKYNYIYIVVCTNKNSSLYGYYYIGKHSTNNLNDNYIASGIKIKKYLKKYPNDYYRKILEYSNTEEELNNLEYNYIHGLLNTSKCLNLSEGGAGCSKPKSEESNRKHSKTMKNKYKNGYVNPMSGKSRSEESRYKISGSLKRWYEEHPDTNKGENNPMYGKSQSEESNRKRSESMKIYWQNKKLNK